MTPETFRNLVKQVSGREVSSDQAKNFLQIFESDLNEAINAATRSFIKKHFVVSK